jgi:hypothetical protein
MQQGSLRKFLSAESATTAAAQVRRDAEWRGVARNAAFHRNVRAFVACCAFFAYATDLGVCHGVKVGIR